LTVLLLLVVLLVPAVAEQVRSVGARKLVAFHVLRLFAGINFLVLASRGILPDEFAVAAGWGDIAVGATAILVCWWCFPLRTAAQRRTLLLWNAFGLVDILGVLANGIDSSFAIRRWRSRSRACPRRRCLRSWFQS
jgi:hypothetical protein